MFFSHDFLIIELFRLLTFLYMLRKLCFILIEFDFFDLVLKFFNLLDLFDELKVALFFKVNLEFLLNASLLHGYDFEGY